MPPAKITELDYQGTLASGDLFVFVDVDDFTMSSSGTNKSINFFDLKGNIPYSQSGDNVSNFNNDAGYLTAHPSITAASSSDNSGRTYIQDVLLDSFGHVTGVSVATETVVDTNTTYTAGTGLALNGTVFNIDNTVIVSGDNISKLNNDAGYLTSLGNVQPSSILLTSIVNNSGNGFLVQSGSSIIRGGLATGVGVSISNPSGQNPVISIGQSVATTDNVRFATVAVGGAISSQGMVAIRDFDSSSTSSNQYGIYSQLTPSASGQFVYSFLSAISLKTNNPDRTVGYYASDPSVTTGSVNDNYGFYCGSLSRGGNGNYGFYGFVPDATGSYNLYMAGTAPNYFASTLLLGTATKPTANGSKAIVGGDNAADPTLNITTWGLWRNGDALNIKVGNNPIVNLMALQSGNALLTSIVNSSGNGIVAQSGNSFVRRSITGTANQITVTNGSGVNGDIGLSLPQDIATTSDLVFQNIAINGAIGSDARVRVYGATRAAIRASSQGSSTNQIVIEDVDDTAAPSTNRPFSTLRHTGGFGSISNANRNASSGTTSTQAVLGWDENKNICIGGTPSRPTSGSDSLIIYNTNSEPVPNSNQCALYAKDFIAGNSCPTFKTENNTTIQLNQSLTTADSPSFTSVYCTNTSDIAVQAERAGGIGGAFYIKNNAAAGGWARGLWLKTSGDTLGGGFTFFGSAQSISLFSIGVSATPWSSYGVGVNSSNATLCPNNLTVGGTSYSTANNGVLGVGSVAQTHLGIRLVPTLSGVSSQNGIAASPAFSSDCTSIATTFSSFPLFVSASFNTSEVRHFSALNAFPLGASTITTQIGFYCNDLTRGTNNKALDLNVSSGVNRWNIFASGTANNYIGGDMEFGSSKGVILRAPNGSKWRLTVDNSGNLSTTSV